MSDTSITDDDTSGTDGDTSTTDDALMGRALELAARGLGATGANPMVGCVVLDAAGAIVGEGWHERYGGPHAEVNALAAAGDRSRGGTLVVTLEPCSHHGKTPPCAEAVVASGVARVVAAMEDPFPEVAGRGFARLRAAGIAVEVGPGGRAARLLNAAFLKRVATGLPYVVAKYAMTLDGRTATAGGHSKWISGPDSRAVVHRLRGTCEAIVAGIGTVLADDPLLTPRPPGPARCARYLIDPEAATPPTSQVVQTATAHPTTLLVRRGVDASAFDGTAVGVCPIDADAEGKLPVESILRVLGQAGVSRVFVEGGGRTLGRFFDAGQVDELHVFVAPKLVGGRGAHGPIGGRGRDRIPEASDFATLAVDRTGDDVYMHGVLAKPWLEA